MSPLMSLCLVFLFSFILAAPLDTRTVFDPQILSPNADSVWTVGQVETVVWNATGIPAGVTGMIKLGFQTSDSENLSTTLASGFNLTDGKVNVTVPAVVTGTHYIVVVFGDSGNASPQFTIKGTNSTSASSSATSTKPASTSQTSTSNGGGASVTPSTSVSSSAPLSTSTAPPSSSVAGLSSAPGLSSSSSLPTSSSAVTSPSPSPSTNAARGMDKIFAYQVLLAPAAAALLLVL